jgi:hypothetical protein
MTLNDYRINCTGEVAVRLGRFLLIYVKHYESVPHLAEDGNSAPPDMHSTMIRR